MQLQLIHKLRIDIFAKENLALNVRLNHKIDEEKKNSYIQEKRRRTLNKLFSQHLHDTAAHSLHCLMKK